MGLHWSLGHLGDDSSHDCETVENNGVEQGCESVACVVRWLGDGDVKGVI